MAVMLKREGLVAGPWRCGTREEKEEVIDRAERLFSAAMGTVLAVVPKK